MRKSAIALGLLATFAAHAQTIQFRAKTYTANLETGITKARGDVHVEFGNQVLTSDEADIESAKGLVIARGNAVFTQDKLTLKGETFTIDMNSGNGKYEKVIMTLGADIRIEAVELERIAPGRFVGKNIKISSCVDCPESWSVVGSYLDFRADDIAEVHNALFQVKDIPISYLPIFIFPTASKRRSGLLVPQFANGDSLGFQFLVPYYWVHSDHSDSTFEYRYMSEGGHRIAGELRSYLSDRTYIDGNASYVKNFNRADDPSRVTPRDRYGYAFSQRYQLTPQLTQRFIGEGASDTSYSSDFDVEFPSRLLPSLQNEPSLSYQTDNFIAYGRASLHRDNLPRAESEPFIHKLPEVEASIPSYRLFGPLRASGTLSGESFRRFEDPTTAATPASEDRWIREGDRGTVRARLAAPQRLVGAVSSETTAEVRGDFYNFRDLPATESDTAAYRGRLFLDQRLSTQLSRVYLRDTPNEGDLKAVRHSFEPSVRWSYSPPDLAKRHAFFDEPFAPRFDLFDPNSPDISQVALGSVGEEQRLGNHHLATFGLGTRVVGRYGNDTRTYTEFFSALVEQDVNLWLRESVPDRLGRLKISANASYLGFGLATEVAIDWKTADTNFTNVLTYGWSRYRVQLNQRVDGQTATYGTVLEMRHFGPWSFVVGATYDDSPSKKQFVNQLVGMAYDSPSKCWGFSLDLTRPDPFTNWNSRFRPTIRFSLKEYSGGQSIF